MPFCVCASLSLSLGVCVLAVTWAPAAPDSVCVFPITALVACCFTGIPLSCFTDFENCFLFIFFTLKGNITYVQKLNALEYFTSSRLPLLNSHGQLINQQLSE